jgi:hypothetical protein
MQEWHGTQDRPACLEAAVPRDHDVFGDVGRQFLADNKRRAAALKDRGVKAALPVDRRRRGPFQHDQIADAPEMCHNRLDLAELLRPARKAAIETHTCGC